MSYISNPTRISTAATPTTVYTAPAGGAWDIGVRAVVGANATAGRIEITVTRGGNIRRYEWIPVIAWTPTSDQPYLVLQRSLGSLQLISGDTLSVTTPQSIDFDIWVHATV